MKLLHIQVSPNGKNSGSRTVCNHLVEKLKKTHDHVITRDLAANPLPHVTAEMVAAYFTPGDQQTPEQKAVLADSDKAVDELLAADTVVISTPMWNFGMPSSLKAWIDHISRAGRTFSYGPTGFKGLAAGKKVYLVLSSGSIFSSGPMMPMDSLTPSLKTPLAFLGMTDVEVIRVEGTNDPVSKANAIEKAKARVAELVF